MRVVTNSKYWISNTTSCVIVLNSCGWHILPSLAYNKYTYHGLTSLKVSGYKYIYSNQLLLLSRDDLLCTESQTGQLPLAVNLYHTKGPVDIFRYLSVPYVLILVKVHGMYFLNQKCFILQEVLCWPLRKKKLNFPPPPPPQQSVCLLVNQLDKRGRLYGLRLEKSKDLTRYHSVRQLENFGPYRVGRSVTLN